MESPYYDPRMRHTQFLYHGIDENPYFTNSWKTYINEHADHQHEHARADPESFARGSSSDNLYSLFCLSPTYSEGGGHLLLDEVRTSIPKETQYTT